MVELRGREPGVEGARARAAEGGGGMARGGRGVWGVGGGAVAAGKGAWVVVRARAAGGSCGGVSLVKWVGKGEGGGGRVEMGGIGRTARLRELRSARSWAIWRRGGGVEVEKVRAGRWGERCWVWRERVGGVAIVRRVWLAWIGGGGVSDAWLADACVWTGGACLCVGTVKLSDSRGVVIGSLARDC